MEIFVQQLINGITLGSIYGLIAIGYTMVFGIIGMVNFAHGDVFMVSTFVALIMFLILSIWLGVSSVIVALVVILVVDQMRADYVGRFQGNWTGGLKRMVTDGAWFSEAAYPYLTTVTCAGHATSRESASE